jgi:hypothetical protein
MMDGKPDYLGDNDFQRLVEEAQRNGGGMQRARRQGPDGARPNTQLKSPVCIELLSSAPIAPIAIRWLWREWPAEVDAEEFARGTSG